MSKFKPTTVRMSALAFNYGRGLALAMDAGERTGKVVVQGGKFWYRKPNDVVRYGPFESASEAAEEARKNGVAVDANTPQRFGEVVPTAKKRPEEMTREEIEAELKTVLQGSMRERALRRELHAANEARRLRERRSL